MIYWNILLWFHTDNNFNPRNSLINLFIKAGYLCWGEVFYMISYIIWNVSKPISINNKTKHFFFIYKASITQIKLSPTIHAVSKILYYIKFTLQMLYTPYKEEKAGKLIITSHIILVFNFCDILHLFFFVLFYLILSISTDVLFQDGYYNVWILWIVYIYQEKMSEDLREIRR